MRYKNALTDATVFCICTLLSIFILGCAEEVKNNIVFSDEPASLPAYLVWVFPSQNEIVHSDEFSISLIGQSVTNEICVKLDASSLVDEDDTDLAASDFLERSTLRVDGHNVSNTEHSTVRVNELGLQEKIEHNEENTPVVVARYATGPFVLCWEVELEVGIHHVEFEHETSSDMIHYFEWWFALN